MNGTDFDVPWLRGSPAEAYARFARELAALCAPGAAGGRASGRGGPAASSDGGPAASSDGGPAAFGAAWSDACRRFGAAQFTAAGAPFGANAGAAEAAAAFARATAAPPLGATREHAVRWQAWLRAAQEFVAAAQAFGLVLGEIGSAAGERYALRLGAPDAATAPLRVLFDDWIECAEAAWQDAVHRERFCAAQARVTNAFVAWRVAAQAIAADAARTLDVPTRSEVDDLQRTVLELQRELTALRAAAPPEPARAAAKRAPPKRGGATSRRRRTTPR